MSSVLILTQYYPPETGAPQNRLSSLAKHLQLLGMQVSVLTAMPNYPAMQVHAPYRGKWYIKEEVEGITVHRSWIYAKKASGIFIRLLNYFSFVFSAIITGLFKVQKHDIIICESPPLFLGIAALIIKFFKWSKLVFNVSDLWPESAEKLGIVTNTVFLKLAYRLEASLYNRSALITGQTQGIVNNIAQRFPLARTLWLPNGIDATQYDTEKITYDWRVKNGYSKTDFILLYAGILGHAQVLDVILKAAAILQDDSTIKFAIVGDGPQKEMLHQLKAQLNLSNLHFYPNQPAAEMPNIINAIDAAIVPLKNIPLFMGAIPSKIFENLAFGKPILLGVDGESRQLFIDKGDCGLFFTPENAPELAEAILCLKDDRALYNKLAHNGKAYVRAHFDRAAIAKNLYKELKSL